MLSLHEPRNESLAGKPFQVLPAASLRGPGPLLRRVRRGPVSSGNGMSPLLPVCRKLHRPRSRSFVVIVVVIVIVIHCRVAEIEIDKESDSQKNREGDGFFDSEASGRVCSSSSFGFRSKNRDATDPGRWTYLHVTLHFLPRRLPLNRPTLPKITLSCSLLYSFRRYCCERSQEPTTTIHHWAQKRSEDGRSS